VVFSSVSSVWGGAVGSASGEFMGILDLYLNPRSTSTSTCDSSTSTSTRLDLYSIYRNNNSTRISVQF
jgi:hypothetical protein